jgi:predicted PurR-regulated permease PerM
MSTEAQRISQLVFYAAVLLICGLAYRIFQPFLVEIAWAVVLTICLDRPRGHLERRLGPTRAALLLTLGVIFLLVVPTLFVGTAAVAQAEPAVAYVRAQLETGGGASGYFHRLWEWLQPRVPGLPAEDELRATISAQIGDVAQLVARQAGGVLKGALSFLFSLLITLGILFFLLRDSVQMARALRRILPFGPEQNERLIKLTSDLVSASVTATIAISATQAVIGGLTFALLGIGGAAFWALVIFVLAFLPLVGAALVWAPAAAWLALSGSLGKGVVLAAVGVLVLGNVDNVVRPLMLSGKSQMNTLVLVLSLMGGVSAFGFIGIVLGPLVAALFTALIESYRPDEPAAEAPASDETPAVPSAS